MKLLERIKDWYLTRKTGKTKDVRDYEAWHRQNVNVRATRIKDKFKNFKHIIVADPNRFLDLIDPFGWHACEDAQQYFWPVRPLGENCIWSIDRVIRAPSTAWEWEINELGGTDRVFVATNDDEDAVMIALKYGG